MTDVVNWIPVFSLGCLRFSHKWRKKYLFCYEQSTFSILQTLRLRKAVLNFPDFSIISELFKNPIGVKLGSKRFIEIIISNFLGYKMQEKVLKSYDFRTIYGCGGRTRTYDLRVMSPTSFQLLYSAICLRSLETFGSITQIDGFVNTFFLLKFRYI